MEPSAIFLFPKITVGAPTSVLDRMATRVQDLRTYSPRFADPRLLAIPTSCGRVADLNLNWADFYNDWLRITPSRRVVVGIVLRVLPRVSEGHADLASSSPSSPHSARKRRETFQSTVHKDQTLPFGFLCLCVLCLSLLLSKVGGSLAS